MRTWQDWEQTHQPFELDYHSTQGIAWCRVENQFRGFWDTILEWAEIGGGLDVGCGPRPPLGPGSYAIDPLAFRYKQMVPEWWKDIIAFNQPAESPITELAGKFNSVLCWNCLDHTIGWKRILANLKAYGTKQATFAIATDFKPPHIGHPGFEREDFFKEVDKHFEVTKYAEDFQERDVALVMK